MNETRLSSSVFIILLRINLLFHIHTNSEGVCLITGMFELALWGEKRMDVWNGRVFKAASHSQKRV